MLASMRTAGMSAPEITKAMGKVQSTFGDPSNPNYILAPGDRIGEYVLDANDSFIISAEFANGAIGTIHSSRWASGHSNDQRLRVYGNKGGLELSHGHWGSLLRVCAGEDVATSTWREVRAEPVQTNYHRFAEAVRTGVQADPDFRHAAELQKILDLALVADLDRKE